MASFITHKTALRSTNLVALVIAGSLLSGCVGGTTYGTGVSQEAQTIQDLSNILAMKKKKNTIQYDSRPDIVIPEQKVLVEPKSDEVAAIAPDWPESPEQRIARIRAEAEESEGSLIKQVQFANQDKDFRSVQPQGRLKAAPIGQGVPNVSCDPDGVIMRRCTAKEISDAVRAVRKQEATSGNSGLQRKYLTEPPIEYRTPATTAVAGDAGYTEEELAEIARLKKERQTDLQNSKF